MTLTALLASDVCVPFLVRLLLAVLQLDASTCCFPMGNTTLPSGAGNMAGGMMVNVGSNHSILLLPTLPEGKASLLQEAHNTNQTIFTQTDSDRQRIIVETTNIAHAKEIVRNDFSAGDYKAILADEFNEVDLGNLILLQLPCNIEIVLIETVEGASDNATAELFSRWIYNSGDTGSKEEWKLWNATEEDETPSTERDQSGSAESASKLSDEWVVPDGTHIPSIRSRMLTKGQHRLIPANARQPIPFSNDIFEGHLVLIIQSSLVDSEPEPYHSKFQADSKNRFEVQVQGKFKQKPTGTLFLGAEITKKMELGLLTRGVCSSILQLLRSYNPFVHYSFGDSENSELPHICSPLWSSADRLIITPSGETPPPLIEPFVEDIAIKKARKARPDYTVEIDLDSIYSISFKTSKMDFEKWAVVNMPFMRAMDLHTFWADADLRLVAYMVPADVPTISYNKDGLPIKHPIKELNYFFSVQVQHATNHPEWEQEKKQEEQQLLQQRVGAVSVAKVDEALVRTPPISPSKGAATAPHNRNFPSAYESLHFKGSASGAAATSDLTSDDDEPIFFDAVEGDNDNDDEIGSPLQRQWKHSSFVDVPSEEDSVGKPSNSDDGNDQESVSDSLASCSIDPNASSIGPVMQKVLSPYSSTVQQQKQPQERMQDRPQQRNDRKWQRPRQLSSDLRGVHNRRVIAAIEVDDMRSGRKSRGTLYLFHVPIEQRAVLRSYSEWQAVFPLPKLKIKPPKYARMSDVEKRRYHLDSACGTLFNSYQDLMIQQKYNDFFDNRTVHNESFLTSKFASAGVGSKKLRVNLLRFTKESFVCVQVGNHAWSEELLGLTLNEVIFIKLCKGKSSAQRLRIPLHDVRSVQRVRDSSNPLPVPGCFCFAISTFARNYCVVIRGAEQRDHWIELIDSALKSIKSMSGRGTFYGMTDGTKMQSSGTSNESAVATASAADSTTRRLSINLDADNLLSLSAAMMGPTTMHADLLAYPKDYSLGDKMILNGRNYTFESLGVVESSQEQTDSNDGVSKVAATSFPRLSELLQLSKSDPVRLLEVLLSMAFELIKVAAPQGDQQERKGSLQFSSQHQQIDDSMSPDTEQLWIDFMDGVSLLQGVDLNLVCCGDCTSQINCVDGAKGPAFFDPSSAEGVCIFLNLYHCLLIHAFLVVGLPTSLFKWSSFFRNCSYEAFGDIFSLAELEHCVIRNAMSRPGVNFLAQLLIPNLEFEFQSDVRDYRLLWAVNCCSISNISQIPIYSPGRLQVQLEYVVRRELEQSMRVKKDQIVLPVICQWYMKEFEFDYSGRRIVPLHTSISTRKLLEVLQKHLQGDLKAAVESFLRRKKGTIAFKYANLDFKCKFPTELDRSLL